MKWLKKILYAFPLHYMVRGFSTIPIAWRGKWVTEPIDESRYFWVESKSVSAVYGRAMISMRPTEVLFYPESDMLCIFLDNFSIDSLPHPRDMPHLMKGFAFTQKLKKNGLIVEITPVVDSYFAVWKIPNTNEKGNLTLFFEEK